MWCDAWEFGTTSTFLLSPLTPTDPPSPHIRNTEVAQWRANRILTPAKRGRKPGSGKKNVVKAASGKPAFVNLDMSQYSIGTVLLQVREQLILVRMYVMSRPLVMITQHG